MNEKRFENLDRNRVPAAAGVLGGLVATACLYSAAVSLYETGVTKFSDIPNKILEYWVAFPVQTSGFALGVTALALSLGIGDKEPSKDSN